MRSLSDSILQLAAAVTVHASFFFFFFSPITQTPMEAGWELFAMGMDMELDASPNPASTAYMYGLPSTDTLRIDDLLDFSSSSSTAADTHLTMNPTINSNIHHSHFGSSSSSFPDDLYTIHSEEAAELEWLSQFVEDSFSVDMIPNPTPTTTTGATTHLRAADPPSATGRGARSKRSRPHVINAVWSSSVSATSSSSSSTTSELSRPSSGRKRSGGARAEAEAEEGGPRRCTHCQSEKTPQWRLGPKGPKTLCNACGVRYKSGRLVPEYRPAASPTFILSQHSNSHRKVMELRRQNEMIHHPGHDASNSSSHFLDYEVC